jgi:hypothetical protein
VPQAAYGQETAPTSLYGTFHSTRLATGKAALIPVSGRQVFKLWSISLERLVDEAGEDALRVDILRGQSPGMVRKQLGGRLLVYDVVRRLMA